MRVSFFKSLGVSHSRKLNSGFTLLEIIVVLMIVGVLAAIATPVWIRFWENQKVIQARNELRLAIQQTQASAIATRQIWRFSLREVDGHLEWATHPDAVSWKEVTVWQSLDPMIVLDDPDTTLVTSQNVHYARFGFKGELRSRLGTITLDSKSGIAKNKCIILSNLLGATRKGEEHLYKNSNGRYCY